MATTLIHKGIRYVSDSSNYFKDTHDHYYLKYKPKSVSTIGDITLSPNVEYYIASYNDTNYQLQLSLSHLSEDIIGTISISKTDLLGRLNMPAAKIRFHPNGGTMVSGTVDSEGFYTITDKAEIIESTMDLSELVSRSGYVQTSWRISHINGTEIKSDSFSSVNLHTNYAVTFPETEIRLIAEWQDARIGKTYTIYYRSQGKQVATQTYTFDPTARITLSPNQTVSRNGWSQVGWSLSGEKDFSDINDQEIPDYNHGSEIPCNKESFTLYAWWVDGNRGCHFNNDGGREGWGDTEFSASVWNFKKIGALRSTINDSVFGKTGVPRKRGHYFKGWERQGDNKKIYQPDNEEDIWYWWTSNNYKVLWEKAPIAKENEDIISVPTFDGHILVYQFTPSYRANYTIEGKSTNQILRITDSLEQVCLFQDGKSSLQNKSTKQIELDKGQTYYVEIAGKKGGRPTFKITKTPVNRSLTINPLGGTYRTSSGTTTSTANHTHTFTTDKTYVGISTTTLEGTNSNFTGGDYLTSSTYPGQPFKNGFQFKQWIGSGGIVDIASRTLGGKSIYTTNYTPSTNFTAYAHWKPNRCFVKYDGNGKTSGHMPNSEHLYNISSSVFPNNYQKTAKIIFDSRGGIYTSNWSNSPQVTVNTAERSMTVTHSFNKWNDNKNGTGTSYKGAVNDCGSIKFTGSDYDDYGVTKTLYAIWNLNSITLPKVERAGFRFMGWYKANGTPAENAPEKNMNGDPYAYGDTAEITLYAHWEPIGLVQIYTDEGWKQAIPYIYTYNNTTKAYEWKRAMSYVYNGSEWKRGAGSGQNMTNEQLEDL